MNGRQARHADEHAKWVERAQQIKERVSIGDVVGRVVKLKGTQKGNLYGFCPFHANSDTPAFVVNQRKKFFHCFGCGANGDVIKFVMLRQPLPFREAIELLESQNGIRLIEASKPAPAPAVPQVLDRQALDRSHEIEKASVALTPDCPPVRYLLGRAIIRPADYGVGDPAINDGWPVDLRYLERCWHGFEKRNFPALVAAIRGYDGTLLTMHRTYLALRPDGSWGKAVIDKPRLVVGSFGPGYIRLGEPAAEMVGGEGIETSLSAMQLWRRAGLCFVTSGRMKSIEPPFMCSDFIYAADKGGKGNWGEKFAKEGAASIAKGRRVAVKIPRIAADKGDYNDLVQERAAMVAANAVREVDPVRDGVVA